MYQKENFIEKANKKFNNKFNYSKVEYKGCTYPVIIICPIHGEFEVTPSAHLRSKYGGCKECKNSVSRTYTTEEFIKKAKLVHKDEYNYSKVKYINAREKVCIICPEHGEFWQTAYQHLQGQGCPECSKKRISKLKSFTTEEWINKAKEVYGDKYTYNHTIYNGSSNNIIITCPIHGDVEVNAGHFLRSECGCKKCKGRGKTTEDFVREAKEIHGDKYNYNKVIYKHSKEKVIITCPIHGDFEQIPNSHLRGKGCPKCGINKVKEKKSRTTEQFIIESKKVHGDKYDYSKVNYTNKENKVTIICPIHGEFEQKAGDHLRGCGCEKCKESKGERLINSYLKTINLKYSRQYPLELENRKIFIDFRVEYNNKIYFIEYNGIQHYQAVEFFGGERALELQQHRDTLLFSYCIKNNIELIEIPYSYTEQMVINKLKTLFNDGK